MYQHIFSLLYSHINYRQMAVFLYVLAYVFFALQSHKLQANGSFPVAFYFSGIFASNRKLNQEQQECLQGLYPLYQQRVKHSKKITLNIKYMSGFLSYCHPEQLSICPRFIMIVTKNNYARLRIIVYLFDIIWLNLICSFYTGFSYDN